jgi:hypothetical protein
LTRSKYGNKKRRVLLLLPPRNRYYTIKNVQNRRQKDQ